MFIPHEKLVLGLCRKHLLEAWSDMRNAYEIILQNTKKASRPELVEFIGDPLKFWCRLALVQTAMYQRHIKAHPLPLRPDISVTPNDSSPLRSAEEQLAILKREKKCKCKI